MTGHRPTISIMQPTWKQLYGAAGMTLAPAVIFVAGQLPPPHHPGVIQGHVSDVPLTVSVSPGYHAGTATYNPHLGHAALFGGPID